MEEIFNQAVFLRDLAEEISSTKDSRGCVKISAVDYLRLLRLAGEENHGDDFESEVRLTLSELGNLIVCARAKVAKKHNSPLVLVVG